VAFRLVVIDEIMRAMAVALTKGQELIDVVNQIDSQLQYENPFLWRSKITAVVREAEALLPHDVVPASVVLGMVACLRNDLSEMRSRHENAIRNAPSNGFVIFNYAQSLRKTGFYSEAAVYFEKSLRYCFDQARQLEVTTYNYMLLGRWDIAQTFYDRYRIVAPEDRLKAEVTLAQLNNFLHENEIPAEDVARIRTAANDFLLSRGQFSETAVEITGVSSGADFLYWKIPVRATRETIRELNSGLADYLSEQFEELYADRLVIAFTEKK